MQHTSRSAKRAHFALKLRSYHCFFLEPLRRSKITSSISPSHRFSQLNLIHPISTMFPAFLPTPVLSPSAATRFRTHHPPRCALQPPPTPKPPTKTSPPPPPRLSNLEVVLERLSDTLIDARLHFSRLLTQEPPVSSQTSTPHVVILGSGWAAHSLIKVIDPSTLPNVTLISPRNFFFFTPLLNASAVGTVEFRSIVEPIRKSNPFVKYFEASAEDIDIERKIIICKKTVAGEEQETVFNIPYDVLVIAVGETTATFGVKGAREYAFFLKEISDARSLRIKLLGTSSCIAFT